MYKVIITPLAHLDEENAYVWYEEKLIGLGDDFLTALENANRKISENPTHFSFIDSNKEIRDYLLPRFPFLIAFRIKKDAKETITIHHAKKHPLKIWKGVPQIIQQLRHCPSSEESIK